MNYLDLSQIDRGVLGRILPGVHHPEQGKERGYSPRNEESRLPATPINQQTKTEKGAGVARQCSPNHEAIGQRSLRKWEPPCNDLSTGGVDGSGKEAH